MDTIKTSIRGRPIDPELQNERKTRLLDAAEELLVEKTYRSITIRDIAARADMKSAMIGYYFGGKEQLFIALLERVSKINVALLSSVRETDDPVKGIISMALSLFARRPFIVRLLIDEIIQNESPLRDAFIRMMPGHASRVLPDIIKREQNAGHIRSDLDPRKVAFSLVSLLVLPFLGATFRRDAWGFSDEEVISQEWAEHVYQLFMNGAAGNKAGNRESNRS